MSGGEGGMILQFETTPAAPSGVVVVERRDEEASWTPCPPGAVHFPGGRAWMDLRFETGGGPCRVRFEFDEETGLPLHDLVRILFPKRPDEEPPEG